jgi:hypothetical protein
MRSPRIFIAVLFVFLGGSAAPKALAIPSYARQTTLSCDSCHITFPRLNPVGRLFKLNGYTLTGIKSIVSTAAGSPSLKLTSFMPMSAMVQASQSWIGRAAPGQKSAVTEFPQQLSFFIAGEITPHLGTFIQITYDDQGAQFGWDNTDIRLAFNTSIGSKPVIFGLTLNNNPTVQDVWNSTPAWGFPYISPAAAPAPQASPIVGGTLAGEVAGLGGYAFYDNLAYAEFSAYVSTPQGGPFPAGPTSMNTIRGVSPYWRAVVQHSWGALQYVSLGTYGISSSLVPQGIIGPVDRYTDLALDLQYERALGPGGVQFYGTWIHESQRLEASFLTGAAASIDNHANAIRANVSYDYRRAYVLTLGFFDITGGADPLLYYADPLAGSRLSKPDSAGFILEADLFAWQNAVLTLQYTLYTRFNGAALDYDGFGRDASDNNTLYLSLWIAF